MNCLTQTYHRMMLPKRYFLQSRKVMRRNNQPVISSKNSLFYRKPQTIHFNLFYSCIYDQATKTSRHT
jgi:hypothetical protein